jgi:hypothetical protein
VEFRTDAICSKCQQAILSGEGFGYVCFKIPGQNSYHFFHRRFRSEDCWEAYVKGNRQKEDRV